MGIWSNLLASLGLIKRRVSIILVGLDNSGKTTLLEHNFKEYDIHSTSNRSIQNPGDAPKLASIDIVPTIGFKADQFQISRSKLQITCFDMSGQGKYRDLWEHFYTNELDAIIFVIDASDHQRICVVRDEFEGMLKHPAIQSKRIPILLFANKMDLEAGMTVAEISTALGLESIREHNWHICALYCQGVHQGLEWLADELTR
ncbi:ADP-ribosylation factor family-domain-containing protein [Polychytrium aggregatum]|uniref:ADP-ribosylation factor family-domain-containing protein n=1 Tax=Polychytrium aggregatum TaxID=110093 RepID=UPI0022FDC146|nr:ADP-ribosylation factor family-domain-containing protein [Polychytrium aggregatum]KAI9205340.1 ADP-ribosylation factor family-domain-containing protein [Polychytrium aggregatum]